MRRLLPFVILVGLAGGALAWTGLPARPTAPPPPSTDGWTPLPSGLELGSFLVDPEPVAGDGRITALRIDPARFALRLQAARTRADRMTTVAWLERDDTVLASMNATMFETDDVTATSKLVADGYANQPHASGDNSFLVFDPPRMIDRTCEVVPDTPNVVQGIRMMGCGAVNTWAPQPRIWSEAAIGQDAEGRILFVFARSPWPMHTFVEHARVTGAVRLQHADGGPPAQIAWRDGDRIAGMVGTYETGVAEGDEDVTAWPIPNLLGVVAR